MMLLKPLQRQLSKGSLVLLFIIAGLGFVDASYLTVEHYLNSIPPCAIGGCETVLTSDYSSFIGLPISLFGALYYLTVLVLFMIYKDTKKDWAINLSTALILFGTIVSVVLIGLQMFVLHAYCLYCMFSDILSIILCVALFVILKKHRQPLATETASSY